MRTLLVVASLWGNAEPAATKQPIGPWLTKQAQALSKIAADVQVRLDKWAASTHDCVFDIQVVSLAEEAAGEVRFLAELSDKRSASTVVLTHEKAQAVQAILPHILMAGHGRSEAQHMVSAAVGKPAIAAQYVKTPVTYVEANGVARTGLTARQQGDQFQLTTSKLSFSATEFSVSIVPDRGAMPFAPAPTASKSTSLRGNVRLGESLVLFRDVVPVSTPPAGSKVVQAAAVQPEKELPRATLFIITPRRGPKLRSPPPEAFKSL